MNFEGNKICGKEMCDHLYHYTRINVLKDIFNDPNGKYVTLQFTDYRFLNDLDEGSWYFGFLKEFKDSDENVKKIFEKDNERAYCKKAVEDFCNGENYKPLLRKHQNEFYTFSFSKWNDSMQFWRQDYANKNGICLCANKEKILSLVGPIDAKDAGKEKPRFYALDLKDVRYLKTETIMQILPEFVEIIKRGADKMEFDEGFAAKKLADINFMTIKNDVWESEYECRMIFTKDNWNESMAERVGKNKKIGENIEVKIVKSIKKEVDEKNVHRYKLFVQNPFDEIVLGPSFSDDCVDIMSDWLMRTKYGKIKVSKSRGHERSKRKMSARKFRSLMNLEKK